MPRKKSEARLLEEKALEDFKQYLSVLPDPRRPQGQRYPLVSIVVIALMAMVCGCDDAEALDLWGETNEKWLAGFLDLPHGAPTQDVFLNVLAAIDSRAFSEVFTAWVQLLRVRLESKGKHIAIDGKTSRRSFDKALGKKPIHTVSAWLSEEGLVLGQVQTREKSNEITAIPELLEIIDIRGATITIDAMGCQSEIAEKIIEKGGDYLLAVKENQENLYEDIQETFAQANEIRHPSERRPRPETEIFEETTKGHGRIERRIVQITHDLKEIRNPEKWANLSTLVMVKSERTVLATGKTSREFRLYIGSRGSETAQETAQHIRRHWTIENNLHWVLDVAFREDEARHRKENLAANFTTLRHFVLNLIKNAKDRKLGVANTRKQISWKRSRLVNLFANGKCGD